MPAAVFHAPPVRRSQQMGWLSSELGEPNGFVNRVVRNRARRASLVVSATTEDIAQYARLELWRRWPEYDNSVASPRTFAVRLVSHAVTTFVLHHRRKRRFASEAPVELEPHMPMCRDARRPLKASDLRLDAATAISALPGELSELCHLLKHHSASAIIRRTGLSRGAFYRRVDEIRSRFEDAALNEYLHDERTH